MRNENDGKRFYRNYQLKVLLRLLRENIDLKTKDDRIDELLKEIELRLD